MKKIQFVNPVRECIEIQGKGYTVTLIATIVAALVMSIIAAIFQMPVASAVSGLAAVASVAWYGWWFGTKQWSNPSREED